MVMCTRGIVAAENPLAAQTGAVVLAVSGHAVDAAIAANAVMGVVAPMMNGIGGDLFAIVHDISTHHPWSQRERVVTRGCDDRVSDLARNNHDAADRHSFCDRPRSRFRVDGAPREIRTRVIRHYPLRSHRRLTSRSSRTSSTTV